MRCPALALAPDPLAARGRRPVADRAVLARRAVRPEAPDARSRWSATRPARRSRSPEQVATYLRALAQAAPDRTRLIEYARTWEGRPLWLFVVGSPERIAQLDQVKADIKRLADPRGLSTRRRRPPGRDAARSWCGSCTACTATRSARPTRRCSRPTTCWRPAATPASTRCCATRSCSSTRCRTPTAGPGSCSRTCRAGPRCPIRRPTTPSTTSRGRAAARTTTCST